MDWDNYFKNQINNTNNQPLIRVSDFYKNQGKIKDPLGLHKMAMVNVKSDYEKKAKKREEQEVKNQTGGFIQALLPSIITGTLGLVSSLVERRNYDAKQREAKQREAKQREDREREEKEANERFEREEREAKELQEQEAIERRELKALERKEQEGTLFYL